MLLIDAVYIHESGGKVLLDYLLDTLGEKSIPFFILLDDRCKINIKRSIPFENTRTLPASEKSRKQFYASADERITSILCFANVPPPVQIKNKKVFVFFQNTLFLSSLSDNNGYSIRQKLSFLLRNIYIRFRNRSNYRWIVQTAAMKSGLLRKLGVKNDKISVIPFFAESLRSKAHHESKAGGFVYVADGVPQKNHKRLFDAWHYLHAQYGLTPVLHVTIPHRFPALLESIRVMNEKGLRIVNHGFLSKSGLTELYRECDYLVFPSLAESFGLPMIEAAEAGCNILASDLPYVYDIIQPTAVFDPYNVRNIAEVVAGCLEGVYDAPTGIRISNHINELVDLLAGK